MSYDRWRAHRQNLYCSHSLPQALRYLLVWHVHPLYITLAVRHSTSYVSTGLGHISLVVLKARRMAYHVVCSQD